MAARAAPGGASSVVLGSADPEEGRGQRREDRAASLETPEPAPRFPQAPGGNASICLGGSGAAGASADPAADFRGPVGGAASISLGSEDAETMFGRRKEVCWAGAVPEPALRFSQPPGGDASICLGGAVLPGSPQEGAVSLRGPVGGTTTIVLGTEEAQESFRLREHRLMDVDTPAAAPRFQQAPGGTSTVCLGGDRADAVAQPAPDVRGPVGGAVSLTLGSDSPSEVFARRRGEREAAVETPAAAPRFPQTPGGTASICLGGGAEPAGAPAASVPALRPPVGGRATVVLGSDESAGALSQYRELHGAAFETPGAAPRFLQAPGGASSLCLGPNAAAVQDAVPVRGPVAGATSICLGGDGACPPPAGEVAAARGPVGGPASVVLGTDSAKEAFEARLEQRGAPVDTPDAAPRFQQAPGGVSSLRLAYDSAGVAEGAARGALRGPVGGAASVVLGSDDYKAALSQRQEQRGATVETPDAAPRFPQAPGGNESAPEVAGAAPGLRGPVGGPTSILLGSDDSTASLRTHQEERRTCLETPDAAPRFQQAPGGFSSISLADDQSTPDVVPTARGPVGGPATIVLGTACSDEVFHQRRAEQAVDIETPGPAPRFQQAPGGDASISLSSGGTDAPHTEQPLSVRGEVGGSATVVLGIDDSRAILAQHREQRQAAVETPDAAPRFTQAPGGTSSVLLGGGAPEAAAGAGLRRPPGGASTLLLGGDYPDDVLTERCSANAFARGCDQNCGNVLAERPTTKQHQAPGGNATICLGGDDPCTPAEGVSANRFARGSSQNTGNVLTDRSTTRLHHAPGGASTLCLGGDYPEAAATRTRSKATARASAPARGAPAGDENLDVSNVAAVQQDKSVTKPPRGGTGTTRDGDVIVLG